MWTIRAWNRSFDSQNLKSVSADDCGGGINRLRLLRSPRQREGQAQGRLTLSDRALASLVEDSTCCFCAGIDTRRTKIPDSAGDFASRAVLIESFALVLVVSGGFYWLAESPNSSQIVVNLGVVVGAMEYL
ncbi:MAG: hypothetical protein J07HQX50_01598 [Haloquadratum sp. J07HQX50]|nr:MAG: hypothetical protein J07HQX50_01598 [Haloquadratum sp. J07HQX50]